MVATRRVLAPVLVILPVLALAACATLDRAATRAGEGVKRICEKVPEQVRDQALDKVNAAAAPHHADITCQGDTNPDG